MSGSIVHLHEYGWDGFYLQGLTEIVASFFDDDAYGTGFYPCFRKENRKCGEKEFGETVAVTYTEDSISFFCFKLFVCLGTFEDEFAFPDFRIGKFARFFCVLLARFESFFRHL